MEFGIFSDEGQMERGFYSKEEAEAAIKSRYSDEDEVVAAECCHDHPENQREGCEQCNSQCEEEVTCECCCCTYGTEHPHD